MSALTSPVTDIIKCAGGRGTYPWSSQPCWGTNFTCKCMDRAFTKWRQHFVFIQEISICVKEFKGQCVGGGGGLGGLEVRG